MLRDTVTAACMCGNGSGNLLWSHNFTPLVHGEDGAVLYNGVNNYSHAYNETLSCHKSVCLLHYTTITNDNKCNLFESVLSHASVRL